MSVAQDSQAASIAQAREALQRGDPQAARALLLAQLEALPQSGSSRIEALYLLAVCERYCGDHPAALRALEQLQRQAPEHARASQEHGHLYRAMGESHNALAAYAQALSLNPALVASHTARIELLQAAGAERELIRAQAQLDWLNALPQPLRTVLELLAQSQLGKAERLCRSFLQAHPQHVEGMRLLADIGSRLGILDDAEFLLESAVSFEPEHLQARMDYVQVLRKRQKFAAAEREAAALLERHPQNPQLRSLYAIELMQTGNYAAALQLLDQVLAQVPGDAATLTNKGHALKTSGRSDEAVAAYRAAIAAHPQHGEAYYALANLKTYRFADDELVAMRAQIDVAQTQWMQRVYLCFALGKAFEDRRDFEAAFAHYAQGNALKRSQSRYDAQRMHDELVATQAVCDASLFARHLGGGEPARDPIFVVGLPRAGSTLIEQILASHSQVDGTLELPNILSLSQHLRRRAAGYPQVLAELSADEVRGFGQTYLEETRIHRQQAPHFVDKMPNNFRHIGLIRLLLPNARIIDARRAPMACCFSGFKQLFAQGQEFSYDLTDIGRYYRDYVELMDHWDRVLPGFVLRVQHEAVVNDLEGQVRRLLDFCGLPFEPACLNYHQTARSVRTPSSEQVRQPIFRDSLEQWRHFEPYLAPLQRALGPDLLAETGL